MDYVDFEALADEHSELMRRTRQPWSAEIDAALAAFVERLADLEKRHGKDLTAEELDALRSARTSAASIRRAKGDRTRKLIDLADRHWN